MPEYYPLMPADAGGDDEEARRRLQRKVAAERAYFLDLMRQEPEGFLTLLPILMGDDPEEVLLTLDPEVARIVFQLAAMACADIVAEAGGTPEY